MGHESINDLPLKVRIRLTDQEVDRLQRLQGGRITLEQQEAIMKRYGISSVEEIKEYGVYLSETISSLDSQIQECDQKLHTLRWDMILAIIKDPLGAIESFTRRNKK